MVKKNSILFLLTNLFFYVKLPFVKTIPLNFKRQFFLKVHFLFLCFSFLGGCPCQSKKTIPGDILEIISPELDALEQSFNSETIFSDLEHPDDGEENEEIEEINEESNISIDAALRE